MQSIKYVRVVKSVEVFEDNKISFRYFEIIDDFIEIFIKEAYSAAGETWFGWWLVEHYLPYHVNCPDGCVSGEPTRGRKDPPYFQMSYGSLDHIPDLVDPLVESPLPA